MDNGQIEAELLQVIINYNLGSKPNDGFSTQALINYYENKKKDGVVISLETLTEVFNNLLTSGHVYNIIVSLEHSTNISFRSFYKVDKNIMAFVE